MYLKVSYEGDLGCHGNAIRDRMTGLFDDHRQFHTETRALVYDGKQGMLETFCSGLPLTYEVELLSKAFSLIVVIIIFVIIFVNITKIRNTEYWHDWFGISVSAVHLYFLGQTMIFNPTVR